MIQPGDSNSLDRSGVYGVRSYTPAIDDSHDPTIIPIPVGESLGGFNMTFTYWGSGTPAGPQKFVVGSLETFFPLDPRTFLVQDSTEASPVPEPISALMLIAGVLA